MSTWRKSVNKNEGWWLDLGVGRRCQKCQARGWLFEIHHTRLGGSWYVFDKVVYMNGILPYHLNWFIPCVVTQSLDSQHQSK
jgi:hypothetical protein